MSLTNDFFKEVKGLAEDFQSLREENAKLRSKNENLTMVGNAMAGVIGLPLNKTQTDAHIAAWNAAKEGGSK